MKVEVINPLYLYVQRSMIKKKKNYASMKFTQNFICIKLKVTQRREYHPNPFVGKKIFPHWNALFVEKIK